MDVKFFTDKGMKLSHGDFAWMPLSNSMVEIKLLPSDFIVDINYEESDENCPWAVSDALRVLSNPWRHTKSWRPSMSNFQPEVKPIPQTNIETPEEKEVEWVSGDKCSYEADNDSHTFIAMTSDSKCCIRYDVANNFFEVCIGEISKPETETERVEREREELSDLTCENLFGESIQNCRKDVADTVRCMIEAGYRKESE